jgi:hypothetical protein
VANLGANYAVSFWLARQQALGPLDNVEIFAIEGGVTGSPSGKTTYFYFDFDTTSSTGVAAQELVIAVRPSETHAFSIVGHYVAAGERSYCLLGPSALVNFVDSDWEQRDYISRLLKRAREVARSRPKRRILGGSSGAVCDYRLCEPQVTVERTLGI